MEDAGHGKHGADGVAVGAGVGPVIEEMCASGLRKACRVSALEGGATGECLGSAGLQPGL